MVELVLRNNYFEFKGKIKQQISAKATRIKCAPFHVRIYMDQLIMSFSVNKMKNHKKNTT